MLLNKLLHRTEQSGLQFMLLKLDVIKAFDKLEWGFLIQLLEWGVRGTSHAIPECHFQVGHLFGTH